jgi:hypothetical protein
MKNRVESSIITNNKWKNNFETNLWSLALCMKDIKELLLKKLRICVVEC